MTKTTPVTAWAAASDKEQIRMEEDLNLNTVEEQKGSFVFLLNSWAENVSYGGVPYIVKNKGYPMKLFWIALVLGGACVTTYQLWQVFDKFLKYPVNINVNMTYTNKITFPAVTVCNVNPVRVSQFGNIPAKYWPLFSELFGDTAATTGSERFKISELFLQIYNSMDYFTKSNIGHQRDDMILECMFNGQQLDVKEFFQWTNAVYGNCFTFNTGYVDYGNGSGGEQARHETFRTGPKYGLTVEMFLEAAEYSAELTDQLGVKLIIGPHDKPAFPEDGGIYLSPGTYSSISIQKVNITRLASPYPSKCIDMTNNIEEAMNLDAYVELFSSSFPLKYDISTCLKTCYQSYVIAECGCGDPKMPINTRATRIKANQTREYGPCITVETVTCQYNVTVKFSENLLDCSQCRVVCTDIGYASSISTAQWPNPAYLETKLKNIASAHPKLAEELINSTTPRDNLLKFNVHFEELNYEVIYETPAYPADSIYSDIGGVLGLWLGLSFIAVFELFQLAFDALSLCIIKLGKKRADRLRPPGAPNKF